jgi:hypothetical protein
VLNIMGLYDLKFRETAELRYRNKGASRLKT